MKARAATAFVFVMLLWGMGLTGASGAGLTELAPWLVRFTGGLKGVYTPVEGRPLAWSLAWSPSDGTVRKGEVAVTGADLALRVVLDFDAADNRLSWRVVEGRVDLAAWLPELATRPELAEMLKGMTVTGALVITGEGTVKDDVVTGELSATWAEGKLSNAEQGWSLEGVSIRAGGDMAELEKGRVPVEVEVRTISTGRFGARNFSAKGRLTEEDNVEVQSVRIEIAGGEVMAEPFTVSLESQKVGVILVMSRVGLQDLIVFVPTTLSEARGRINGKLRLDWNPVDGVQIGVGELSLDKSEPTLLRLVSTPGFLTEQVPARFVLAPWLGPLKGLFSPKNPSYPTLQEIELGKLGLRVDALEVRLNPDGDEKGRSASVHIRARPEREGSAVREVTFQVNVAGPLAEVLRMGMQQNLSIQTH
ncbi:MAG: YdbH domain-containing protein [Opitutaceae bacterium]|nr:YdbH domain-containing protein [Opitutaceae bacterium]